MNPYLEMVAGIEAEILESAPKGYGSVAVEDQALAAARHSIDLIDAAMPDFQATQPEPVRRRDGTVNGARQSAMVIAALRMPWMLQCQHAQAGSVQPTMAVLSMRVVLCQSCASTHGLPEVDPTDVDRCDFCGQHGNAEFTPIVLRMAHYIAAGDACDECAGPIAEANGL